MLMSLADVMSGAAVLGGGGNIGFLVTKGAV